ncbi:hypothetical protein [Kangiella japonica]|uniref:hypothetical protein n=1 Tax=Kangiella japonica TaxID=647384 RepID=UPI0031CE1698
MSDSNAEQSEKELEEILRIRAAHFAELSSGYLSYHKKAIENLSEVISDLRDETEQVDTLKHWNTNYTGFLTMLITDERGLVIKGVLRERFEKLLALPELSRMVSDRDYFIKLKRRIKASFQRYF